MQNTSGITVRPPQLTIPDPSSSCSTNRISTTQTERGCSPAINSLRNPAAKDNAAKDNNASLFYIETGTDKTNTAYETSLYRASKKGDTETVKALISAHTDRYKVNHFGRTPLFAAARYGHTETVKTFILANADIHKADKDGKTPIYAAACNGHTETVKALLSARADIHRASSLDRTPLFAAACNGHVEIVKALLSAHAEPDKTDKENKTPLYAAACNGHTEIVIILLSTHNEIDGADINFSDHENKTPLYAAACNGHTETVKALLAACADIHKADTDGSTPLLAATYKGHTETVKALISAGADIHSANSTEQTPLFIAARHGHTEIVKALISAGADVQKPNTYGETPLQAAAQNGFTTIADMLQQTHNIHNHAALHIIDATRKLTLAEITAWHTQGNIKTTHDALLAITAILIALQNGDLQKDHALNTEVSALFKRALLELDSNNSMSPSEKKQHLYSISHLAQFCTQQNIDLMNNDQYMTTACFSRLFMNQTEVTSATNTSYFNTEAQFDAEALFENMGQALNHFITSRDTAYQHFANCLTQLQQAILLTDNNVNALSEKLILASKSLRNAKNSAAILQAVQQSTHFTPHTGSIFNNLTGKHQSKISTKNAQSLIDELLDLKYNFEASKLTEFPKTEGITLGHIFTELHGTELGNLDLNAALNDTP